MTARAEIELLLALMGVLRLSPGRVLARHEPDPGGKLASAAAMSPVINTGYERGRNDATDPRDGRQAAACRVLPADRHEARIQRPDPPLNIAQLIEKGCKQLTREIRQRCVRHRRRPLSCQPRWPLGHNDPVFGQQTANLVDHGCSLADQAIVYPVYCLKILRRDRFHRHKAHGRTAGRLEDRRGIDRIVLCATDERLHETRVDQAHVTARFLSYPPPLLDHQSWPGRGRRPSHNMQRMVWLTGQIAAA